MELKDLIALLLTKASEGSGEALKQTSSGRISKAKAYRLYGRGVVDRWILEGLIRPAGDKLKTFDGDKLAAVAATSNRNTYLPVVDRNK